MIPNVSLCHESFEADSQFQSRVPGRFCAPMDEYTAQLYISHIEVLPYWICNLFCTHIC